MSVCLSQRHQDSLLNKATLPRKLMLLHYCMFRFIALKTLLNANSHVSKWMPQFANLALSANILIWLKFNHISFFIMQNQHGKLNLQPSWKKDAAPKRPLWKRCEIQCGSQEMAVMVGYNSKILITTGICVACFTIFGTKFTWIVVIKILPLAYHHSHFLATTLDFTSFFTMPFLGCTLLLQLGCFGLDFIPFCNCILCS